tara:strand:+ start:330 stop:836 length:507 start_codon:yes stop_codon:yes gene_type:complete
LAQEFFIKSADLEAKVRQLLPSQGGLGAGQDLSASTQIVPIVDLTESAEGSNFRQDLQTAFNFANANTFDVINTTSTLVNNTGFYRVFASVGIFGSGAVRVNITDGVTTKEIIEFKGDSTMRLLVPVDFVVYLRAGDSLTVESTAVTMAFTGSTRQIADVDGNLVNPL